MRYRVLKGEEHHGRDLRYVGTRVLWCNNCGYVGTFTTDKEIIIAKEKHENIHIKEGK